MQFLSLRHSIAIRLQLFFPLFQRDYSLLVVSKNKSKKKFVSHINIVQ